VKIYELAKTVQMFERASHDEGLRIVVPPVVAASFGVYPLALEDDLLTLACPDWVGDDLVRFLERGLGHRIRPVTFEKEIILGYITKVYLQDGMVNVNTFVEEDFFSEKNLERLFREKEETPSPGEMRLAPEKVVFLDLSFRSNLRNIDRSEGYPFFAAESLEMPYQRNARDVRVFSGPLGEETFCLIKRSNLYCGVDNRHGFCEHRLKEVPFHIHPTEVQICGAEPDGSLMLYIYDRLETVRPGERPRFRCTYHFLHLGNRYCRQIDIRVHDLVVADRDRVRYESCQPSWSVDDLDRWLGLDWGNGG
jgi:hypothetical protein